MIQTIKEDKEIELLLQGIFKYYGYDFREYSRPSLYRRINKFLNNQQISSPSRLLSMIVSDQELFHLLIDNIPVFFTEMFRDPVLYQFIRIKIVPYLLTYPSLKIWHAGCATGEEAYSMAILLLETGLYDRSIIYATDLNEKALRRARQGRYPLKNLGKHSKNYKLSGGIYSLSDHYFTDKNDFIFKDNLRKNIIFSNHNLAIDKSFGEMNMIVCRNVFIYFNKKLQNSVITLFNDSLCYGGYLILGIRESIQFLEVSTNFELIDDANKIYKKITK